MEAFEPPKYTTSLIAAVNDGAKSAQAGALLFLLVGLYLLASAFSTSDEDLLLGKAVAISQIGASLPVSFSFAIAPLVFVFLHIYTLARYDLLAANVRQLRRELRDTVPLEADRERCRQLLANVEFIVALAAPRGSALYSPSWPWLFRSIVVVFPVMVLLLVQINALRYQNDMIVWVQRVWLTFDLMALVWFFRRNALDGSARPERRWARVRRWTALLLAPVFIGIVNLLYLNTVRSDANMQVVRYEPTKAVRSGWLAYAVRSPLDLILCPQMNWGCRFLLVDHRTLVGKAWDDKAVGTLRMKDTKAALTQDGAPRDGSDQKATMERAKALAAIEGVFLRDRSLRFAVLNESRLYAADLIGADLRNASLWLANLNSAKLFGADLSKANLSGANLRRADLRSADLSNANLNSAKLFDADLSNADLRSADLSNANLSDANLSDANLSDAYLSGANLTGANLSGAHLDGQAQLEQACGEPEHLPAGLTLDRPCLW